jgi:hypothetical protein
LIFVISPPGPKAVEKDEIAASTKLVEAYPADPRPWTVLLRDNVEIYPADPNPLTVEINPPEL